METVEKNNGLLNLLQNGDKERIKEAVYNMLPDELAHLLNDLPEGMQLLLFRNMDREKASQTFELLDVNDQKALLDILPHRQVALLINDIAPDVRTALLEELSAEGINKHLRLLTQSERTVALKLLGYPENSIGRLMTPDYIALNKDWTVKEVLDYIREHGAESETLDIFYIVDEKGKLIDDIKVGELLLAGPSTKVKDISDGKFISLLVTDDEESAINVFKKYNRVALPVTDASGTLLGIVTFDDVMQLAEEEDTEDIQKFGAVEALDEPYMDVSVLQMIKKRAPWLVILFIGELFTASAMSYFENEISRALVLALFIPLIVSSGGNTGSQAATLIIRAMALGEVAINDWWRIMRRELVSGFFLGLLLGIIGFLRVIIWSSIFHSYGPHSLLIGITIGCAVMGVVMWGTLMGSMLPLVIKKFGADPATSSAPFIATLVDITGIAIYFTFAALFLRGTLL
ncbi:MAG TPA: magnesium transporter [Bacteroidia bacterium]|nr:magnesium transporter [Bacteroidia bacterium]